MISKNLSEIIINCISCFSLVMESESLAKMAKREKKDREYLFSPLFYLFEFPLSTARYQNSDSNARN